MDHEKQQPGLVGLDAALTLEVLRSFLSVLKAGVSRLRRPASKPALFARAVCTMTWDP